MILLVFSNLYFFPRYLKNRSIPMFLFNDLLVHAFPPKVQQRGVAATKAILNQLLADVDVGPGTPVLVVDALPNRWML